ncbi:MAG: protease inhibitor I42 family protein [Methermicoccaceae archaeon]
MKGTHLVLFAASLLVVGVLLSGCATTQAPSKVFTQADNGTTVSVKLGETFSVSLPENPTTGYSWNMSTTGGIALKSDTYTPEQPSGKTELVGAGGVHEWVFQAVGKGTQKVMGIYKRPWENTTGTEETFELTLNVE